MHTQDTVILPLGIFLKEKFTEIKEYIHKNVYCCIIFKIKK